MTEQLLIKAFRASEDLQKRTIVALGNEGEVKPAKTAQDRAIGIALAGGNLNQGAFADILFAGIGETVAGGEIAIGDRLHWDNQARVIKATTGKETIGIALNGCDGENAIIRVFLQAGKA